MKNESYCFVHIKRNDLGEWLKVLIVDDEGEPSIYTVSLDYLDYGSLDDLSMCAFAMLIHYKKTGSFNRLFFEYLSDLNKNKVINSSA